jgi:hypothetical protein
MGRQLQHDTPFPGAACKRCGLRYSPQTAYVPCFVEGDTFDEWFARQAEEVRERIRPGSTAGVPKEPPR